MSFRNLNKPELLKAASYFDIEDVNEESTKPEILAALEESETASWSNYKKFVEPEETEENESEENLVFTKMVLLKMERSNPRFDILGHTFTRANPFILVSPAEAQEIIDTAQSLGGGFRIATPTEAKSFFS